jgi:hypothetical protein
MVDKKKSKVNEYFANRDSEECVSVLEDKIQDWEDSLLDSGLVSKIRKSWSMFHGNFNDENNDGSSHEITNTGDQGELLHFPVNHFRNIGEHIINLTTANRPAMQAQTVNTDSKSLSQAYLANGLLEYYLREKNLEKVFKKAVDYAVVLGEGWVKMEWNATSGDVVGFNEETKTYVHNGDIEYKALNPLHVIRDVYRDDTEEQDWLIVKSYKNRADLMAKYPEYEDEIDGIESRDSEQKLRLSVGKKNQSDQVPVYEFYHKRTDACQDGRYILFLNAETVLIDMPLPYRFLPVFDMKYADLMGTSFGYTVLFDLMPIQESINMLNSAIITNQNAFGVQNIMIPKSSDINISQLYGGLNIIEYQQGMDRPEALNLTQTPAEVFNMLNKLEATMETISGVNSVARGNPEANLRSGNALALIQAQAIQFISGLQHSYIKLIEDVGTNTINMLKEFAETPRVAAIVGKNKKAWLKEFKSDDLQSINRVFVETSNPVSKTTGGKVEMANNLLQYQIIDSAEDYFTVMNTGSLDSMVESSQNEIVLIHAENEKLMEGENPPVMATDDHITHIKKHKAVFNDPSLRDNAMLIRAATEHIQEHIRALKETDPDVLMALGQQPLPPDQPPVSPGALPEDPGATMQAPPSGMEEVAEMSVPNMPAPAGNPELPITATENFNRLSGSVIPDGEQ